jgi:hypothetical protein
VVSCLGVFLICRSPAASASDADACADFRINCKTALLGSPSLGRMVEFGDGWLFRASINLQRI